MVPQLSRAVTWAWGALVLNTLAFADSELIVPIPRVVGQAVAQGSLVVAFLLALYANRRAALRANVFMSIMTGLAVSAVIVSLSSTFLVGSLYRASRLLAFVLVLWLLTPWWGSRSMVLLRSHLQAMTVVLASVALGLLISPGKALAFEGRLSGALWPIPPTQVAHYAAIVMGVAATLWMSRSLDGVRTMVIVAVSAFLLLLTHTRTGLAAVVVGVVMAGASLFVKSIRVRRVSLLAVLVIILGATVFTSELRNWLLRGQSAEDASSLTGRTKVWRDIVALERGWLETVFGSGISNQSFEGLPIDNSWLAVYLDQGWVGVVGVALTLILLMGMAVIAPSGPRRAVALFLISYCVIASSTETGLGLASPYLLDLFVAAALLAEPRRMQP